MKFGFEREFFIKSGKELILAPSSLPHDDCGYLVESRGEPHHDPLKAAYLLLAEEAHIRRIMVRGLKLVLSNQEELSLTMKRQALRMHGKKVYPATRGNIYGLDFQPDDTRSLAGLHVHFSDQKVYHCANNIQHTFNPFIEYTKIIQFLDNAFCGDIEEAGRVKGFYEVKPHGFEYRSLPATTDVIDVAGVINQGVKSNWTL